MSLKRACVVRRQVVLLCDLWPPVMHAGRRLTRIWRPSDDCFSVPGSENLRSHELVL